jgi:tetratricopeptide (TPR) repeat protein
MRKYLIISLFSLTQLLYGGSPDSLYTSAGKAYSEGRFEQALVDYQSIVDLGVASADLYYNMGNAAFRSNKLGYAVLYYEKALKYDPSHQEARKNLSYVSQYKEDELEDVPELFIRTWIRHGYQLFSLRTWSSLAVFFFAVFLGSILIYIFSSRLSLKKTGFFTGLVALLFFVLSLAAAVNRNAEMVAPESAVVVMPSVVVKSSPSLSGTDLFVLHEGTKIRVDDHVGSWTEIRISDGREGWIPSDALAMI